MMEPVKLIFGKSWVPSGVMDDVFAGVVAEGIAYQRAPGYSAVAYSKPALEIGDPWSYYRKFWQAHGLDHLANLVPPEITTKVGGALIIPLVIENPLDTSISIDLHGHKSKLTGRQFVMHLKGGPGAPRAGRR